MNAKIHFIIAAIVSATVFQGAFAHAQGSLAPPGAPTPGMKTLAQIEARTPIPSAPITISSSGSYYLTTNLAVSAGSAITINANNVWLDLNGFNISSTETPATSGCGILLGAAAGVTNITIVNGFINSGVTNNGGVYGGSGFGSGISGANAFNTRVAGVSVAGCRINGIYLGVPNYGLNNVLNNSLVESCSVNTAGTCGIVAQTVSDSSALNCGSYGVVAGTANNCHGSSFGEAAPDSAVSALTANNCIGLSLSDADGVNAIVAYNCVGNSTENGNGIVTQIAIGCFGESYSGYGLASDIANSCYSTSGDSAINLPYNMP